MKDKLQILARESSDLFKDIDKKQLRFNEIVDTAILFYKGHEKEGVVELVEACSKTSVNYTTRKAPMWKDLQDNYKWMI